MEDEESYLKEYIKEMLEECNDVELLYLIMGLLGVNKPVSS